MLLSRFTTTSATATIARLKTVESEGDLDAMANEESVPKKRARQGPKQETDGMWQGHRDRVRGGHRMAKIGDLEPPSSARSHYYCGAAEGSHKSFPEDKQAESEGELGKIESKWHYLEDNDAKEEAVVPPGEGDTLEPRDDEDDEKFPGQKQLQTHSREELEVDLLFEH
ncbi:hypothetical protein Efla_001347 [Eimeria flavescens]